MINFVIDLNKNSEIFSDRDLFREKPRSLKEINYGENVLYLWGDPIITGEIEIFENDDTQIDSVLNNIAGHYYYLLVKKDICYIGNSIFSILPIYYNLSERLVLSNNAVDVSKIIKHSEINKRFILENILFNYPLFNQSSLSKVSLLPANSYIKIKGGKVEILKHTNMDDYYTYSPRHWKKSASDISELFIETSKKYFPIELSSYALTGGFDGRTLISCSLYYGNKFDAFCFGRSESDDIIIGKYVADKTSLDYHKFILDEEFAEKHSKNNGLEFIRNASGSATFARAHYLYAAKELAEKYGYIVTGNFGNEVLQATNVLGVVTSPNVYNLFASETYDEAIHKIINSSEYTWLNKDNFVQEWESLLADIKNLPPFDKKYSELTITQKYYITFYEEVMRKYFGAEMTNQFKYIKNRTPFLDFRFFKEIVKTELAGVNREFFNRNPVKRFKGQVIYGHIIGKTTPALGKLKSSWGYTPDDLISQTGKLRILYGYFKRNRKNYLGRFGNSPVRFEKTVSDPFGVNSALMHNLSYFSSLDIDRELFNHKIIGKCLAQKKVSRQLFNAISQVYWNNYLRSILN